MYDLSVNKYPPGTPTGLSRATVSGEGCGGIGTSKMTLRWTRVPPPADCTGLYYRGYQCEGDGCTPTLPIYGFFTSAAANCSGTTCTSNLISVAPSKISNKAYRFAVSAVCEISTCPTAPTTRTWEGSMSTVSGDACP